MASNRGFTLIELLISLALMAVISFAFIASLKTAVDIWQAGSADLRAQQQYSSPLPLLDDRLKTAQGILEVSLDQEIDGLISLQADPNTVLTAYRNSGPNQSRFGSAGIPTASIVLAVTQNGVALPPEVLMDNVTSFRIIVYAEDPSYTHIASPNNSVTTTDLHDISSIKYVIVRDDGSQTYELTQLVELVTARIAESGSIQYGQDFSLPATAPFSPLPLQNYPGFTTTNIHLEPQDLSGLTDIDLAKLPTPSSRVKIRNTGLYFESIQEAIDAAAPGSDILVSSGLFTEAIAFNARSDIRLLGGYDPVNWSRNLNSQASQLITPSGISDRTIVVFASSDIVIEGFEIDGNGLNTGILIQNSTNAVIRHCQVSNALQPVHWEISSGRLENCSVTGLRHTVTITNGTGVQVLRNRLMSLNTAAKPNIQLVNCQNILFQNNIIDDGTEGIRLIGSGGSQQISFFNNVVTNIDSTAIFADGTSQILIENNSILNNNFGIFGVPTANITTNHFFQNAFGDVDPSLRADVEATNLTSTDPEYVDLVDFVLQGSSPLIDQGNPNPLFNDRHLSGLPGQGGAQNDMGVYGGPQAGRLGVGQTVTVTPADNLQTVLSNQLPGDWIIFDADTYSTSTTLSPKYAIQLVGASADTSIISLTGTTGIRPSSYNWFENIAIAGTGSNTLIQVQNQPITFEAIGIKLTSANVGIDVVNAVVQLNHLTVVDVGTGININNLAENVEIEHSIIDSATTGINSQSGTNISASWINFSNTTTPTNGAMITSDLSFLSPEFWDPSTGNFNLSPASPLIDTTASSVSELGCFEFYVNEGTLESPVLTAAPERSYTEIAIEMLAPGSSFVGEAELSFRLNNQGSFIPVSPTLNMTSNQNVTQNWIIAPGAVAEDFQVRITLRSYQYGKTPLLDNLTLSW